MVATSSDIQITFTWGDLVAIYAAAIATIVGVVEIFRFVREIRSKLVVKFSIGSQVISYPNGTLGDWTLMLDMNIVNHSLSERFINQPRLQVDESKKIFTVINLHNPISYPKKLASGEAFALSYDARTVRETVLNAKAREVRALVTDTLGNKYYSKWVKAVDIKPYDN